MQSELVQVGTKLNPQEWKAANYAHYFNSKKEIEQSKLLRDATFNLCDHSAERARNNQIGVTRKLDYRLRDVSSLKSNVDKEKLAVANEMQALRYHISLLRNAFNATELPLEIPKKALAVRRKRTGNDLVRDQVEIDLYKEIELIESVQESLRRVIEQAMSLFRDLESCLKRLHKDSTDKFSAMSKDNTAYNLNTTSAFLGYHKHAVEYDPNAVSPTEWEAYSENNMAKAQNARSLSETLRRKIQELLANAFQQLNRQNSKVQLAFGRRITETNTAKRQLENQHRRIIGEIENMQETIDMLEKQLSELQLHMKVNNTRLEHRTWRPNIELCRDNPKHSLVAEYHAITGDIAAIKRRLNDARLALDRLNNRKWELEQEVNIKTFTLFIDKDQCGKLRSQMDWRPFMQRQTGTLMSIKQRPLSSPLKYSPKKLSIDTLPNSRLGAKGPLLTY